MGPLTRHTPVLGNRVFPADSESTDNGQPLWIFTTQLRLRKQKNKSREGSEIHRTKTPGTGISDPFLRRPTSSHTRIVANPTPGLPQSILRGKRPRVLVKFSSRAGSKDKQRHPPLTLLQSVLSVRPKEAEWIQLDHLYNKEKRNGAEMSDVQRTMSNADIL